jgi:hypothetical protein
MPLPLLTQVLCTLNMSEKKPFVLRIDPEKLKALEKWAADEFRSTNGQIEYILDQALRKAGRWKTSSETFKEKKP